MFYNGSQVYLVADLKAQTLNLDKMKIETQNSDKPQKPQLNILAVIRSKIKNMEYADKVDYFFFRPCSILFLILLGLKITTIITVSWWIVFTPIIIPILVLWWELSKNAG